MIDNQQVALVTGGNGFLGTALIRELAATGVTVHVLANRRQDSLVGLLPSDCIHIGNKSSSQVTELVREICPSTIFHLATVFKEPKEPSELDAMIDGNITLGLDLLFAASKQGKPPAFVNAGSYWQYGDNSRSSPNSLYAATKQCFHQLLTYYREQHNLPATTLVLYETFGENDQRPKLWNRLISAKPGAEIPLTHGEQVVHLVHVTDVVGALQRAAELLNEGRSLGPVYSVHSSHPHRLKDLLTEFNRRAALNLQLDWGTVPYPKGQIFQPWIGQPLPGWEPSIDVLECLVGYALKHRSKTDTLGVRVG